MKAHIAYTVEVRLLADGEPMATKQPVEWIGANTTAGRQAAYDVLVSSSKVIGDRYDLRNDDYVQT